MTKISFFLVLFSVISVFSQNAKTTLKESFLPDYVAQKEKVKTEDISRIVLKKDKDFKHGVILLNSSMACGVGTCTYYAFVKNSGGSFDFAGMIDGVFSETKEIKGADLPEIWTATKSSDVKSVKTKWTYNKETKVYETK